MSEKRPSPILSWTGFAVGALALLAAVGLFWAGPFAPQQSTGVSLGDLAAEVGQAAVRRATGQEQPEPAPVPRDIDDYLAIGTGALGVLAVILGFAGFAREEPRPPAFAAATLGGSAILFQFFAFYAMALLGVLLIAAILHGMGDFFGGLFSG